MQIEYNEVTIVLPKPPSLNKWYSGKHWAVRKKQKETYCEAIKSQLQTIDSFTMDRLQKDFPSAYQVRLEVEKVRKNSINTPLFNTPIHQITS